MPISHLAKAGATKRMCLFVPFIFFHPSLKSFNAMDSNFWDEIEKKYILRLVRFMLQAI